MKILACALVLLAVTPAAADDGTSLSVRRERTIGADAALVLPVGDYAQLADLAFGGLVRLEFPISVGSITARGGIIMHSGGSSRAGSLVGVPLYAGYKYPIGTGGVYLAGELGITLEYFSADTMFGSGSDSDAEIGLTLTAGVRRGALDFRAGLFVPDPDVAGFIASAGFDFASF